MHLFILYLHPLITRLEGICSDQDDLVNAYADDVSVVSTSAATIERVRAAMMAFGLCAGAQLNPDKTKALDIGLVTDEKRIIIPWLHTVERLRLLGILFSNNIRETAGHNWDMVIQNFRHLVRLHRVRDLNLVQKVVLLNTFLLPKLWFVASVCGTRAMDIARVSATIGSLLWNGSGGFRVPLLQLALPRSRGGLNLHIPVICTTALLTNRYVAEQSSLKVGAQHIRSVGNPPNIAAVPSTYPCLRAVVQQLSYIPMPVRDNLSTRSLRRVLVDRLPGPKVQTHLQQSMDWSRVWKNVHNRRLSSEQRTALYLLANGKLAHGEALHNMGRAPNSCCLFCQRTDTLEHKFSSCTRVTAAWDLLQQCIRSEAPECQFSFSCLRWPVLSQISPAKRKSVLRLFANYIVHILGNQNGVIDVVVLKCSLLLENRY